jgi:transcriptional regulator with XRE-family HTH domain
MVTRIGPRRPQRHFLAKWREHRGLTQKQLAERLDVTDITISRWENGKRELRGKWPASVAEALDIGLNDLYRDPERPSIDELLQHEPIEFVKQAIQVISGIRAMAGRK